jgi:hypothetical protein
MDWRDHGYLPAGWRADNAKRVLIGPDDNDEEVTVNCDFTVCDGCKGTGSCVNPNIDRHGISSQEWNEEWDADEREQYRSGAYDITCPRCNGLRVVLTPQEDDPNRQVLENAFRDESHYRAEQEAERRMGA